MQVQPERHRLPRPRCNSILRHQRISSIEFYELVLAAITALAGSVCCANPVMQTTFEVASRLQNMLQSETTNFIARDTPP